MQKLNDQNKEFACKIQNKFVKSKGKKDYALESTDINLYNMLSHKVNYEVRKVDNKPPTYLEATVMVNRWNVEEYNKQGNPYVK